MNIQRNCLSLQVKNNIENNLFCRILWRPEQRNNVNGLSFNLAHLAIEVKNKEKSIGKNFCCFVIFKMVECVAISY